MHLDFKTLIKLKKIGKIEKQNLPYQQSIQRHKVHLYGLSSDREMFALYRLRRIHSQTQIQHRKRGHLKRGDCV